MNLQKRNKKERRRGKLIIKTKNPNKTKENKTVNDYKRNAKKI